MEDSDASLLAVLISSLLTISPRWQSLEKEQAMFPSIARSISNMFIRSPNPTYQLDGQTLFFVCEESETRWICLTLHYRTSKPKTTLCLPLHGTTSNQSAGLLEIQSSLTRTPRDHDPQSLVMTQIQRRPRKIRRRSLWRSFVLR